MIASCDLMFAAPLDRGWQHWQRKAALCVETLILIQHVWYGYPYSFQYILSGFSTPYKSCRQNGALILEKRVSYLGTQKQSWVKKARHSLWTFQKCTYVELFPYCGGKSHWISVMTPFGIRLWYIRGVLGFSSFSNEFIPTTNWLLQKNISHLCIGRPSVFNLCSYIS